MNGTLLLDKPESWTSFDVVNYVRKLIATAEGRSPKQVKVGHTGTLDPMATGLLLLLIGPATKRAQDFVKLDKSYKGDMKLGVASTTGDSEGELTETSKYQPRIAEVNETIQKFTGELMQTPPQYSAIKVDGQRSYALARQGKTVKILPRAIKVYSLDLLAYDYPELSFSARVSSGTYIRALVEDIGSELHTNAYLTSLRRTEVGHFKLEDALPVKGLTMERIQESII